MENISQLISAKICINVKINKISWTFGRNCDVISDEMNKIVVSIKSFSSLQWVKFQIGDKNGATMSTFVNVGQASSRSRPQSVDERSSMWCLWQKGSPSVALSLSGMFRQNIISQCRFVMRSFLIWQHDKLNLTGNQVWS